MNFKRTCNNYIYVIIYIMYHINNFYFICMLYLPQIYSKSTGLHFKGILQVKTRNHNRKYTFKSLTFYCWFEIDQENFKCVCMCVYLCVCVYVCVYVYASVSEWVIIYLYTFFYIDFWYFTICRIEFQFDNLHCII